MQPFAHVQAVVLLEARLNVHVACSATAEQMLLGGLQTHQSLASKHFTNAIALEARVLTAQVVFNTFSQKAPAKRSVSKCWGAHSPWSDAPAGSKAC